MLTIATKNITITLRKDSFIRLEVIMVGLTLDEKVEMNISYFDSLNDSKILKEWQKIKNVWGENPQSSKPLMHIIFDYFLNHRLPYIKEPING